MSKLMSNVELMTAAVENTERAKAGLREALEIGQERPVPPGNFTIVVSSLRQALAAATSLEQRALGVPPAKTGD